MVNTSSADAAISVKEIFEPYDLPQSLAEDLTFHLAKSPNLVQFLMHFQHSQPEQAASRAFTCALTIALGYFLGGFTPLLYVEPLDNSRLIREHVLTKYTQYADPTSSSLKMRSC